MLHLLIAIFAIIIGILIGIKIEKIFNIRRHNSWIAKQKHFYCDMAVLVKVDSNYSNDFDYIEETILDIAFEVMEEVSGGVSDFKPFIRLLTFSDFSIDFIVILRAKSYKYQTRIKNEFVKRLKIRFNEMGLDIPHPIRSLNLKH